MYAQIGDAIPGHLFHKNSFEQHPTLKLVLQDYYSDILEFHQAALSVLIRPSMSLPLTVSIWKRAELIPTKAWRDLFHATWKTFDTRFGPIIQSLRRRQELLQSETVYASLEQVHVMRKEIANMHEENTRTAEKHAQEEHQSRMSLIKNRLRATEYSADQEAATQTRKESGAGEWLFQEPQYVSWSDINTMNHSVLYIHGIPGAGRWLS